MVSNTTTTSSAAIPAKNKLSIADVVALACAIVVLIAFAALPWMSNHTENSEPKTGLSLLSTSGQLQVENSATASGGQTIPAEVLELFSTAIARVFLIPLAALVGAGASLWALFRPQNRSTAILVTLGAGVVGLAYFITIFAHVNAAVEASTLSAGDFYAYFQVGFWVALFADLGLLLQIVMPRPRLAGQKMPEFLMKMGTLGELLNFFWGRRMYWVLPMLIALILFAMFILFSAGSSTMAPFIYVLF
ncbi:MAG: DUF5989 family protein [Chloroflexota bacterium]